LVGPSTAVTPAPGALPFWNGGAEEEKAMFSAGFCVALALGAYPAQVAIGLRFWNGRGIRSVSQCDAWSLFRDARGSRLKLRNESGTNQARIADSATLRLRSPQHLALSRRRGTRSSSGPSHKPRFDAKFLKLAAHPESNQNPARVNRIRWCLVIRFTNRLSSRPSEPSRARAGTHTA
jgi:hypothetical protein